MEALLVMIISYLPFSVRVCLLFQIKVYEYCQVNIFSSILAFEEGLIELKLGYVSYYRFAD